MAKYHVTGIFLVEDPEHATTEVFTSAINGTVGIDAAVVVTEPTGESAILDSLDRLMTEAGVEYQHVVRDANSSLAEQLHDVVSPGQERNNVQSWLWFLTDDTMVSQNSLASQLQAVEISPSVAIAGAKQLADRRLIDVG